MNAYSESHSPEAMLGRGEVAQFGQGNGDPRAEFANLLFA